MIGLPAAALTSTGRAISANAGFLSSAPRIRIGTNDAVKFESETAQLLLIEAVSNISNWQIGIGKSIPVAGTKNEPPFVAHVVPLRGAGFDLFTGAISIMFLTPVVPNSSPAPELLQALFDLTPAEARLAGQLTQGNSIEQIALSNNLSHNTLRTHLKSVFSKTGVQRQAELVSLLGMTIA
jgi:DNA-binding CsgD family transcriptional regulator